jgi:hypothetical protein
MRNKEHGLATSGGTDSGFYQRCPSRELTGLVNQQGWKGTFKNLTQHIAMSLYDPSSSFVDGSIDFVFDFSACDTERINIIKFGDTQNIATVVWC